MDTIRRRHRTLQAAALVSLAMLSVSLLAGGTLRASDNRVITDVTLDGVDAVVKGMPNRSPLSSSRARRSPRS